MFRTLSWTTTPFTRIEVLERLGARDGELPFGPLELTPGERLMADAIVRAVGSAARTVVYVVGLDRRLRDLSPPGKRR